MCSKIFFSNEPSTAGLFLAKLRAGVSLAKQGVQQAKVMVEDN